MTKKSDLPSALGTAETATWNNQIIPTGNTVVSGTPTAGFQGATGVGVNPQVQALYNMNPKERAQIAQALKNAGYKGFPTNGLFNQALATAYSTALMAAQTSAMQLGQPFNQTFFTNYLSQEIAARSAIGTGAGGPKTVRYKTEMRPDDIKEIINQVYRDVLGRGASEKEVAKYTQRIQTKMGKIKNMPTTTYTDVGGGVRQQTTTQGFEPKTYLYQELSQNDEAKQRAIFGFYDAFKRALGV